MKKQSNLSRLLSYAGSRRILTFLSWILAAASALLALLPFWYIWRILKEVIAPAHSGVQAERITRFGWMAVAFAVLSILVYILGLICSHLAAFRIATNLRLAMMRHIAALPLGDLERFGSGKLRRTVSETAGAAETYLAHQLPDQVRVYATIVGLLGLLLLFDWRLGLLSLLPIALGFACIGKMTGKNLQRKMEEYQNALADMSNEAVEYVRGIPVVKTFGQTVFSFKKFKKTIDNYEKWTIAYTNDLRAPMMVCTLAINSVFVFLILGGYCFTRGGVTGEFLLNLIFYIIVAPAISVTLTKTVHMSEEGMIVADAIKRIDAVMELTPLPQPERPRHPKDGSVALDHVTFRYQKEKDAITDLSLRIGAGEVTAFVGPSGGGKTTLARLIARFFDPQSGSVSVGGADVREMTQEELMSAVSFVFQDSRLLKTSILENVRLGRPEATDAEVLSALENAQCAEILEKLPQGARTVIGTKGVYLSGGELQRIAIARAMLKNAPIILLDEATAFADPDNECRVQAALSRLTKGKTVILIAHRLSTVVNADRIFVLQEGRLAEQGKFDELVQADGLFASLWREYQKSVTWKVAKEG